MRVLFLPDYSAANAYQRALAAGLRDLGVEVRADPTRARRVAPVLEALRGSGRPDVIHVHWTEPYIARGPQRQRPEGQADAPGAAPGPAGRHAHRLDGPRPLPTRPRRGPGGTRLHARPLRPCGRGHRALRQRGRRAADGARHRARGAQRRRQRRARKDPRHPPRPLPRRLSRHHLAGGGARAPGPAGRGPGRGLHRLAAAVQGRDRAGAGLRGRCPEPYARLVIAGQAVEADYAARLVALAAADPRVRLDLGFVPDEDLQVYLRAADVVACPFLEIFTSGSVLLAMSFERAVIAPRRGCVPETLDEAGGILYDADDPQGLEGALRVAMQCRPGVHGPPQRRAPGALRLEPRGRGHPACLRIGHWPLTDPTSRLVSLAVA